MEPNTKERIEKMIREQAEKTVTEKLSQVKKKQNVEKYILYALFCLAILVAFFMGRMLVENEIIDVCDQAGGIFRGGLCINPNALPLCKIGDDVFLSNVPLPEINTTINLT